jgi:PncC family amidohydrolase
MSNEILELAQQAGEYLRDNRKTIAAAESCTGGLLMSYLTDVAGSSAYVMGGIVSYSNAAKQHLLGVQEATLLQFGAVSEQTAQEMALGIRQVLQTDIGISITGIAGPGGGTPEKPVGLVYIGLATADKVQVARYQWSSDRTGNKLASVAAALKLIMS